MLSKCIISHLLVFVPASLQLLLLLSFTLSLSLSLGPGDKSNDEGFSLVCSTVSEPERIDSQVSLQWNQISSDSVPAKLRNSICDDLSTTMQRTSQYSDGWLQDTLKMGVGCCVFFSSFFLSALSFSLSPFPPLSHKSNLLNSCLHSEIILRLFFTVAAQW